MNTIKQVVFDVDDTEDLNPFLDVIETTFEAEEKAYEEMELCDEEQFQQQQEEVEVTL